MGTGEDLFYKCCAPSEELSTHRYSPRKKFLEIWNSNYESIFLVEKTVSTLYILIDIVPAVWGI